jgi:hypothetical protein
MSEELDAAPPSTVIDTEPQTGPSGGGQPALTQDPETPAKQPSLRDIVAEETKKDEAPAKPEAEEKPEAKDETAKTDGKFAARPKPDDGADTEADKTSGTDGAEAEAEDVVPKGPRPTHKSGYSAPDNLLPDAKEVWDNVPNAVKRDISVMIRNHEEASTKTNEAVQRYETIRDYDELARANGRDLRHSLERVHHIENLLQSNPLAGLNAILMEAGPRKPDGSPFTLREVAQAVVNMGDQGYYQSMQQAPQQQVAQQQEDPRLTQALQQIAKMQEQQLASQVIEPFKANHPHYDAVEQDIAFFLKSGKIPASLSHAEKLEAAYDMAIRINPGLNVTPSSNSEVPAPNGPTVKDFGGSKSIKSAPGAITGDFEPDRDTSIRGLLESELKRAKRA